MVELVDLSGANRYLFIIYRLFPEPNIWEILVFASPLHFTKPYKTMKAKFVLFTLVMAFVTISNGIYSQNLQWANATGSPGLEYGYSNTVDATGNIIKCGTFSGASVDFDPGAGTTLLTSNGAVDFFVAKSNAAGQLIWAFNIGGTNRDESFSVATDPFGNIYVTGYFRGSNVDFDPGPGVALLSSNGDLGTDVGYGGDIFIAKYSPTGQYLWAKNIGGSNLYDSGIALDVDVDGNVYFSGYFQQNVDFDAGAGTAFLNSSGGTAFLCKYNSAGIYQWAFNYGLGNADNSPQFVKYDPAGYIYMTGFYQGTNIDFDPSAGSGLLSAVGGYEVYVAKYNLAGQYQWARSAGGFGDDVARSLTLDNAGNVYVTGDFRSFSCDFDPLSAAGTVNCNGGADIFLIKYNSAGQYQFAYGMGGPLDDLGLGIDTDNNSLFVSGSFSGSNVDFDPSANTYLLSSSGGTDMFYTSYSLAGQFKCGFKVGGSLDDYCRSLITTSTNTVNGVGYFQSTGVDFDPGAGVTTLSSNGNFDAFQASYQWNIVVAANSDTTICAGGAAQLNAAGATNYTWSPATGLSNPNIANPLATPTVTTQYVVTGSNGAGCTTTDTVTVTVNNNCEIPCNSWLNTPSQGAYVSIGDLDVSGNQLTVEASFNRTAPLNNGLYYGHLVSKHTSASDMNYALLPNGCEIGTTNGYFSTFQNCLPELNKTYHVAMVYDGATLKFYRNGFLQSQTPCTGNMLNNNLQTVIAQVAGGGFPFNNQFLGYVNEVRIWNVARTQSQLAANMNSILPSPTTTTGLLGYYRFDNLLNKQGNAAYNGTLNGSATSSQTNPNCTFLNDSCGVVIPVKLTSFTAQVVDNKKVELTWQTEEESDLQAYVLERSVNANNGFAPFVTVQPRNIAGSRYSYIDTDVKPGVLYYYRLRMKELTGQVKFSAIRIAKITVAGQGIAAMVYPNPSDHHLYVQLTGYQGRATVTVFDHLGRRVLQRVFANNTGLMLLDVSKLAAGSYHLLIETDKDKMVRPWVKR